MPTYLQLETEPVWRAQFVPPALLGLSKRLRVFFGKGPNEVGSPGDNNHLTGRHRSRNWVLQSSFCTRTSYGTRDQRDLAGNGDWYRAIDIGITGQVLYDACRRIDAAVRAGRLPGVAEWFGTYDGKTVVGWYEGRASSSDSSHLWHLHIGFWTSSANDEALMDKVYDIITGADMTPEEHGHLEALAWRTKGIMDGKSTVEGGPTKGEPIALTVRIAALEAAVAKLSVPAVDASALAAALVADPAFKQALADAAFEGAQRAERE